MSETPVIPVVDQNNNQLHYTAERQQTYRYPEREMASVERIATRESQFDLSGDDAINPEVWVDQAPATYEVPAYAEAPKTRAQEVEESLFYLTEKQQVEYARALTGAITTGLRVQKLHQPQPGHRSDYVLGA